MPNIYLRATDCDTRPLFTVVYCDTESEQNSILNRSARGIRRDVCAVWGADGKDRLLGGTDIAVDKLLAGPGNDFLDAGPGDDTLYGLDGSDEMHGGDGSDRLWGDGPGDVGDDILDGGPGDDSAVNSLDGVVGNDQVNGGTGIDNCVTDPDPMTNCE